MTLVKYLPTSSCQRSFWTTPNDKVQNEDYFCLLSRLKKSFHGFWWVLARALTLSLTNLSCYLPACLVLKFLWLWSCFKIGGYFLKFHSCILRVNNLPQIFPQNCHSVVEKLEKLMQSEGYMQYGFIRNTCIRNITWNFKKLRNSDR